MKRGDHCNWYFSINKNTRQKSSSSRLQFLLYLVSHSSDTSTHQIHSNLLKFTKNSLSSWLIVWLSREYLYFQIFCTKTWLAWCFQSFGNVPKLKTYNAKIYYGQNEVCRARLLIVWRYSKDDIKEISRKTKVPALLLCSQHNTHRSLNKERYIMHLPSFWLSSASMNGFSAILVRLFACEIASFWEVSISQHGITPDLLYWK